MALRSQRVLRTSEVEYVAQDTLPESPGSLSYPPRPAHWEVGSRARCLRWRFATESSEVVAN